MRLLAIIIAVLIMAFSPSAFSAEETVSPAEEAVTQQKPETAEEPTQEEETKKAPTKPAQAEETFDEGLFEDVLEDAEPVQGNDENFSGPRRITFDSVIVVKYSVNGAATGAATSLKYHINLSTETKQDVDLAKGNAKIATDISGFLAKSSAFECLLKVSIADVPYEIMFKRTTETEADLNIAFKGQILEDWESLCTFLDASGSKFNTRGAPEIWIGTALEKAKPPLSKIAVPLDPNKATSVTFTIPKTTIEDDAGISEYEGKGVVTIQPVKRPPPPQNKEGGPQASPGATLREAATRTHGS